MQIYDFFLNIFSILFSKQNKTVFCGEMSTNGRKRYFQIDENAKT